MCSYTSLLSVFYTLHLPLFVKYNYIEYYGVHKFFAEDTHNLKLTIVC